MTRQRTVKALNEHANASDIAPGRHGRAKCRSQTRVQPHGR